MAIVSGFAPINTWDKFLARSTINMSTLNPRFHRRPNRARLIRLKVVAKQKNFQFFLDGKLLFEGEDKAQPRFQPNGRIGLICHETNPYFDNLVIEGDQIPASPVTPMGEISIYWGKIKSLISTL